MVNTRIINNEVKEEKIWAERVARLGKNENAYGIMLGKPEGRRPLGRSARRWEGNIKIDFKEVGLESMDWI